MKTQYQYLHFVQVRQLPKTAVWSCRTNRSNDELGEIKWYPAWRQYCYFPTVQAVYSDGCLSDIADFIKQLAENALEGQKDATKPIRP